MYFSLLGNSFYLKNLRSNLIDGYNIIISLCKISTFMVFVKHLRYVTNLQQELKKNKIKNSTEHWLYGNSSQKKGIHIMINMTNMTVSRMVLDFTTHLPCPVQRPAYCKRTFVMPTFGYSWTFRSLLFFFSIFALVHDFKLHKHISRLNQSLENHKWEPFTPWICYRHTHNCTR